MNLNLCQKYILKSDRFVENKNILKGNFLIILKKYSQYLQNKHEVILKQKNV